MPRRNCRCTSRTGSISSSDPHDCFGALGHWLSHPLFLLSKILRFGDLTDFDFRLAAGKRIRHPLDPFDRLVQRFYLPDPVPCNELARIAGERTLVHGALIAGESHAGTLGALAQTVRGQEHAGFHQLLVEFSHVGKKLLVWMNSGFGLPGCFYDHHHTHRSGPLIVELKKTKLDA